jgi:hypothetical protein
MRRPSFALIPLLLAFLIQADLTQAEKAPFAYQRFALAMPKIPQKSEAPQDRLLLPARNYSR